MSVPKTRRRILVAASFMTLSLARSAAAENDYCVTCPNSAPLVCHSAVGGEVGLFPCGLDNPSCSVTYYDARYCPAKVPAPPTISPGCYNMVLGGDCQGNQWCDYRMDVALSPASPAAGVEVTVTLTVWNVGSVTADGRRSRIQRGGAVDWGDGATTPWEGPTTATLKHKYSSPRLYNVRARTQGDYKWHDPDGRGSCS